MIFNDIKKIGPSIDIQCHANKWTAYILYFQLLKKDHQYFKISVTKYSISLEKNGPSIDIQWYSKKTNINWYSIFIDIQNSSIQKMDH